MRSSVAVAIAVVDAAVIVAVVVDGALLQLFSALKLNVSIGSSLRLAFSVAVVSVSVLMF